MTTSSTTVDLSICIVSWNTVSVLRDCLKSVFAHPAQGKQEVIVVDNASADQSAAMVTTEFPHAHLIRNDDNVGFARANNQAFRVAHGRYLLLLNSDTVVPPGALTSLVDFADQHLEAGAVGCKLLNADGSVQRSCWRGFPSLASTAVDAFYLWRVAPGWSLVRRREVTVDAPDDVVGVDHLLGACMLVPRTVVDDVGTMNEKLFLFLEETEWCFRIRESGRPIYFLPSVAVFHLSQRSVSQCPQRTLPERYRNLVWFCRNYTGLTRPRQIVLKLIIIAGCFLRIGLWTWRGWRSVGSDHAGRMRAGYWQVVRQTPSF